MTMRWESSGRAWAPRTDRGVYVVWIAAVAALILTGFASDIVRYLGERPAPPLILHLHGFIYLTWLGLVAVQILLVEKGQVRLHRQLGWATVAVGAMLVPFGVVAALVDEARRIHQPDSDPHFLALEFGDMIAFAALSVAGVVLRRDPAAHKRLMILSAVALSDAGCGRISTNLLKVTPTNPFAWWLTYYWGIALILVAMICWDLWRHRRVHPSVAISAALLWAGQAIAATLYFTPAWKASMTVLVKAWGWAG